jgi:hypothetical protein
MKTLALFCAVLPLFASLAGYGQDTTKPADDNAKAAPQEQSSSRPKIITGCLEKGAQPDQFSITGEDSKTWDLRSSTVKLSDHVGHQVTVTGSITREAAAEEKKEGQVEKAAGKEDLGEVSVTNLKMVSQSCDK